MPATDGRRSRSRHRLPRTVRAHRQRRHGLRVGRRGRAPRPARRGEGARARLRRRRARTPPASPARRAPPRGSRRLPARRDRLRHRRARGPRRSSSWSTSPAGPWPTGCARAPPIPRRSALRWLRETADRARLRARARTSSTATSSPRNLLLDEHGRLAVGDFGIATAGRPRRRSRRPARSSAPPRYLSPEQALRPRRDGRERPLRARRRRVRAAHRVAARSTATHPAAQARAARRGRVPRGERRRRRRCRRPSTSVLRAGWRRSPTARPRSADGPGRRVSRTRSATRPPPSCRRRRRPRGRWTPSPPPPSRAPPRPSTAAPPPRRARPASAAPRRPARRGPHGPRPRGRRPRGRRPASGSPAARRRAPEPGPRRWPAVAALAVRCSSRAPSWRSRSAVDGGGGSSATTTTDARTAGRAHDEQPRQATTPRTTSKSTSTATAGAERPGHDGDDPAGRGAASAGAAKSLNDRGFALLQQGDPTAAVPLLQQSVHGFRDPGPHPRASATPSRSTTSATRCARVGRSRRRDPAARGAPPGLQLQARRRAARARPRPRAGRPGRHRGAAGAGRRDGARQRPARQQRPGQGRRRRGLIPPAGRAIARAGHRDIPRSDDADLAHNSARLTVQGPRAAADSEEHRKDSDAHSQGHRAEARFRARWDSERQGRRRPRRQSRRSLAHTSRDGSHRRDGVAQRDAACAPVPAPADATGGATDADDPPSGAGSRRRTALGAVSGSGRSPPCGSGDGLARDRRRRPRATSRASRGGPRSPSSVQTSATSPITWTRSVIAIARISFVATSPSLPRVPGRCEVAQADANAARERATIRAPSRRFSQPAAQSREREDRLRGVPARVALVAAACARAPAPSCRP